MGLSETSTAAPRTTGRIVAIGVSGAMLGTVLTLALAGTGDDRVEAPRPSGTVAPQSGAPEPTVPAPAATVPAPVVPAAPPARQVTADEAARIAAGHVGGTVDTVHAEDGDHGAAWDVDVYSPDGEYTVYVSGTGQVVQVEGPFRD